MSEKKLRCESWCKDCKAFDWSYCTEKYFNDENIVSKNLDQADVSSSLPEPDFDDDEDDFQCCDNCDLPDACADFGCAIKSGVRKDDGIL